DGIRDFHVTGVDVCSSDLFRVLTISAEDVAGQVSVSDAEIESYYEENKSQFQEPEQVDAAYITLSQGALAASIEVSEEEVRQQYETRAEEFAREERRASHILVEAGADSSDTL